MMARNICYVLVALQAILIIAYPMKAWKRAWWGLMGILFVLEGCVILVAGLSDGDYLVAGVSLVFYYISWFAFYRAKQFP